MKKQIIVSTISWNTRHQRHFMVIKDGLNEYPISRTPAQLQTDLDSVGLTIDNAHLVKNCKAEAVLNYHKAGEQVIDQDGKEAENEDGSKRKYLKDGARFDGFVSIEASPSIMIAQLVVAQMNITPEVAEVVAPQESFASETAAEEAA